MGFFIRYIKKKEAIKCIFQPEYVNTGSSFINTLRSRQNGRHLTDDILKSISLNGNVWILIKIWLKFVSEGPINNIPPLFQIMAWCRPGD